MNYLPKLSAACLVAVLVLTLLTRHNSISVKKRFFSQYTFRNEKRSASQWLLLSYGWLLHGLWLGIQTMAVVHNFLRVLPVLGMANVQR